MSSLAAGEVEEQTFDLDQLSSQFGRFQIRDPQDESWSLVESGAQVGYRGFVWSSEDLRYRTKLVDGYAEPLIEELSSKAAGDESVIIDTRAYQDAGFPVNALFKAQSVSIKQVSLEGGLHYRAVMQQIRQCHGKLQTEGGPKDFALHAQNVTATLRMSLLEGKLYQPDLQSLAIQGQVEFALDDSEHQTYYRIKAEHIELHFMHGQLATLMLKGSEEEPAQLNQYRLKEHKSYSARSLHLVFGTASRLKSLKSSSDIQLQSHVWSGKIKACIEPSAD